MKIDIERILALKKEIKVAAYMHYKTDLLPKGALKTPEDAQPVWNAMKEIFPTLKISEYYVDSINHDLIAKGSELTRLYEDCKKGKYDIIVFPNMWSLRYTAIDVIAEVRKFTKLEHPPILYFFLEDIDSTASDFFENLTMMICGLEIIGRYRKRKRQFNLYLK